MSRTTPPPYHPFRSAEARDRYLRHYDARSASWPLGSEILSVHTDAGETFVRISGPADARPLVLLPGSWDTSLMWSGSIEALSARFRTFAVDNPYDFGRSVSTPPADGRIDYMAWLDGLFDALGLVDDINLMGCSFGAWLTCAYVLHAPERLATAVWLSPPLVVVPASFGGSVSGGLLSLAAFAMPSKTTIGALNRWLMPDAVDAPWFDDTVEDVLLGLRSFKAVLPLTDPRVLSDEELAGIRVPVLYIVGEHERMCSVDKAVERLHRVAPRIRTAIVPGAGHDLGISQSDAFTRTVLEFLEAGKTR
jgi:pimeloyl-ACP methyl ester carboxylesterase